VAHKKKIKKRNFMVLRAGFFSLSAGLKASPGVSKSFMEAQEKKYCIL
jgi:hypothetical protein